MSFTGCFEVGAIAFITRNDFEAGVNAELPGSVLFCVNLSIQTLIL